jgi:hypothetical protein
LRKESRERSRKRLIAVVLQSLHQSPQCAVVRRKAASFLECERFALGGPTCCSEAPANAAVKRAMK